MRLFEGGQFETLDLDGAHYPTHDRHRRCQCRGGPSGVRAKMYYRLSGDCRLVVVGEDRLTGVDSAARAGAHLRNCGKSRDVQLLAGAPDEGETAFILFRVVERHEQAIAWYR